MASMTTTRMPFDINAAMARCWLVREICCLRKYVEIKPWAIATRRPDQCISYHWLVVHGATELNESADDAITAGLDSGPPCQEAPLLGRRSGLQRIHGRTVRQQHPAQIVSDLQQHMRRTWGTGTMLTSGGPLSLTR